MDKYDTNRYIDDLQNIVSTYNSKSNRTLKMSPNNAYLEVNYSTVIQNVEKHYSKALQKKKRAKYNIGDHVRIYTLTKGGGVFRKGYKPIFSDEIFVIYKVSTRLPEPRYFLLDSKNEPIIGSFQAHELSIVRIGE